MARKKRLGSPPEEHETKARKFAGDAQHLATQALKAYAQGACHMAIERYAQAKFEYGRAAAHLASTGAFIPDHNHAAAKAQKALAKAAIIPMACAREGVRRGLKNIHRKKKR